MHSFIASRRCHHALGGLMLAKRRLKVMTFSESSAACVVAGSAAAASGATVLWQPSIATVNSSMRAMKCAMELLVFDDGMNGLAVELFATVKAGQLDQHREPNHLAPDAF